MVLENVAGVFNKRKTEDGQTAFFVFQDILFFLFLYFLKILPCGTISLIKWLGWWWLLLFSGMASNIC